MVYAFSVTINIRDNRAGHPLRANYGLPSAGIGSRVTRLSNIETASADDNSTYEPDRMTELATNYYNSLQYEDIAPPELRERALNCFTEHTNVKPSEQNPIETRTSVSKEKVREVIHKICQWVRSWNRQPPV